MSKPFGVGIVGCGLIGRKRANALGVGGRLVACMDLDSSKAEKLALDHGCEFLSNWKELISRKDVELVIVSTLHDSLAEITQAAMQENMFWWKNRRQERLKNLNLWS